MKSIVKEEDFDCGEFTTKTYDTNIRQFIRNHLDDDSSIDQSISNILNTINIEIADVHVNLKNSPKNPKMISPKLKQLDSLIFSPRIKLPQSDYETSINLSHANLQIFPEQIMKYNNSILQINLSKNLFNYLPIELMLFKNLKVLTLDYNYIKFLPNELINLSSLEILSLGHNQLKNLPPGFSKLSKTLKELNIEYNYIETISKDITGLNNLHILNVSHNYLKSFPTIIFKNMLKLEELSFEWFKYNMPPGTLTQKAHEKNSLLTKLKGICQDLHKKKILTINFSQFITYMCKITVNFETRYGDNRTILHIASNNEDFSVIDHIASQYPKLIDEQDAFKHTALSYCLLYNKLRSARFLFMKGANPLLGGGNFGSLLHIAVEKMNVFFTKSILKFGEKVDILDFDGNTSLHLIMGKMNDKFNKATKICNILLENGANPNLKNNDNWCPIHILTRRRDHQAISWIARYNKENNKNLDQKNLFNLNKKGGPYRWTPMHIAAYTESSLVAEALGEANVHMFKRGSNGHTAKKLVGIGSLTMKIIEKYERKWLFKNVLNREIMNNLIIKPVKVFNSYLLRDTSKTKNDSMLNTQDLSLNIEYLGKSSISFGRKSVNAKLGKQDILLKTLSYIESKNYNESSEIAPETEIENTTHDIVSEADIPLENMEEVKSNKRISKRIDDIIENNSASLRYTMKESARILLSDSCHQLEGLNCDPELYDDFLKEELRINYQTFKNEVHLLKENLLSESTILSDKFKLFGMFKVLNNHVLDYIYTYCNLEVNKYYHGIIYFNEKLAITTQGEIHKNTLAYMNHYYDLIPNAIIASYMSLQLDKPESILLKKQLIMFLGEVNYFPAIQFLMEITKISTLNRFIFEEAINTLNYLQTILYIKIDEQIIKNKARGSSKKLGESKAIPPTNRGYPPKKLLKSQKTIFLAHKKIKEKMFD